MLVTTTSPVRDGWGIPVATDTAFALMVLVLLGERMPAAARAFLVGLEIVDDLGAMMIITFAYTTGLVTSLLLPTGACLLVLLALNLTGVRYVLPYIVAWRIAGLRMATLGVSCWQVSARRAREAAIPGPEPAPRGVGARPYLEAGPASC